MNRPFWLFFVLLFISLYGCQRSEEAPMADRAPALRPPGQGGDNQARGQDHEIKTPLLRKLLAVLDDAEADADQKDYLRKMLQDADENLHGVTGENSKLAILRANQKRTPPLIEPRPYAVGVPTEGEKPPIAPPVDAPAPAESILPD